MLDRTQTACNIPQPNLKFRVKERSSVVACNFNLEKSFLYSTCMGMTFNLPRCLGKIVTPSDEVSILGDKKTIYEIVMEKIPSNEGPVDSSKHATSTVSPLFKIYRQKYSANESMKLSYCTVEKTRQCQPLYHARTHARACLHQSISSVPT